MRKQEPPFTVQIELTEGCNRGCSFCGLHGMRKDGKSPFYYMTKETAERIADEMARLKWNSRLLFAMHGEPTLNKDCEELIHIFRDRLPKAHISMFTNGAGIIGKVTSIKGLKRAGVNNLMVELYEDGDDGHTLFNRVQKKGMPYTLLTDKEPFFPNSSWRLAFCPPIVEEELKTHSLCNHCGAAFPKNDSCKGKRCTRPFRELSFRYDGSVALCCNDFRGEYPIGNINEMDLDDLWQSKRFNAARVMLYAGKREFTPCLGCDAKSFRVGLLPDKLGKETLPEPTEQIEKFAKRVSEKSTPLCGKDWRDRPWESTGKKLRSK